VELGGRWASYVPASPSLKLPLRAIVVHRSYQNAKSDWTCNDGVTQEGAIAKWLRRQIRNLFLFEGAGSNPAGVG
jgi:hypothetical protein